MVNANDRLPLAHVVDAFDIEKRTEFADTGLSGILQRNKYAFACNVLQYVLRFAAVPVSRTVTLLPNCDSHNKFSHHLLYPILLCSTGLMFRRLALSRSHQS
ncbi:hypothetical protein SCP_0110510 [Sparassis crispa]|uniref:Uncharacterized protein n=1 Tax=Sparassis crispa TaxID=139825 RepID=A0A401G7P4_9APHY|nr:hypothetical protein SCP_0110510 [Sparassis crispa]GBE78168.1 hypothetical protein SCP_0110510 [Sparassis crispa]